MSEALLKSVLCAEINTEDLTSWLEGKEETIETCCSIQEFVTYFLSYIRNATTRYVQQVQSSTNIVTGPGESEKKNKLSVTQRNRINLANNKSGHNLSEVNNHSVHTSTPKSKNKSYSGSEISFTESPKDYSYPLRNNKSNHSFDRSFPTLENYFTRSLLSSSRENISLNIKNKKKKKCGRLSESPVLNSNQMSCNRIIDKNEQNIKVKHEDSFNSSKTRRIKPTILSSPKPAIVSSNSFSFNDSNNSEQINDISVWHRNILREEKEKIAARTADIIITAPKYSNNPKTFINPCIKSITQREKINRLVSIYESLFNNGLVLSHLTELHFLLTLLLSNVDTEQHTTSTDDLLNSVHNCVYFAATTLATQDSLLHILNRPTLKLLIDNARIQEFTPSLASRLSDYYTQKVENAPTDLQKVSYISEQMTFNLETDSRENFPNDNSFHTFRKQRDMFYELLRSWEQSHAKAGWSFATVLGSKVKTLLSMHKNPANYYHLARLIKNQLLNSNVHNKQDDDLENINNLLDVSSDKLNKLKNRLVNKETVQGYTEFPNFQEFYRDFINCSQSHFAFLKHMENVFADGIISIEEHFYSEDTDSDYDLNSSLRNIFIPSLKSTKLLAKFLGYIEALPYKTDIQPKDVVLKSLISVRKQVLPVLDLHKMLKISINNGNLLLTIPWVIEFLEQLDYVALRLPVYEDVLQMLVTIHYNSDLCCSHTRSALLIKLCLGDLFESTNFPRHLCYSSTATSDESSRIALAHKLPPVSEEVLYLCVPKLFGLRTLLATGAVPVCIRYIRPVTAATPHPEQVKEREQKQLEDVFFHGHPESVKRLVDFVSERIASAIVKMFKKTYIEKSTEKCLSYLQRYITENRPPVEDREGYEVFLRTAMETARSIAEEELVHLKASCKKDLVQIAKERCDKSIPALLPYDVHSLTTSTCSSIATRKGAERVTQWIDQSLNLAQLMDPLTKELSKMDDDSKDKQDVHITQFSIIEQHSVVKIFNEIKNLMYTAHLTPDLITTENVMKILNYTRDTIRARKDIGTSLREIICVQTNDLVITLIMTKPEIVVECMEHVSECLQVFNIKTNKNTNKSINVVNVRNIYIVSEATDSCKSWHVFKKFILVLLIKKILPPSAFEEQVLKLFQQNFPEVIFNTLVRNLQEVLEEYSSKEGRGQMVEVASCLTSYLVGEL